MVNKGAKVSKSVLGTTTYLPLIHMSISSICGMLPPQISPIQSIPQTALSILLIMVKEDHHFDRV